MTLAQKLYEKGLITYMRTDSPMLSSEALNQIKKQIMSDPDMGESYYQFRQFKAKGQMAQEAHEAIRPTHIDTIDISNYNLEEKEIDLYKLIWNRTIASQMKSAIYEDQHIIVSNDYQIKFNGTHSVLVFDGYLKLYSEHSEKENDNNNYDNISAIQNKIKPTDQIKWIQIKFAETFGGIPQRYSEPTLVKKLESLGIGRPSTYANVISTIQTHNYVRIHNVDGIEKKIKTGIMVPNKQITIKQTIQKIGYEKQKLIPTSDGMLVTEFLVRNFPQILNYKFTAQMEKSLDDIANGQAIWHVVLRDYYRVLTKQFETMGYEIDNIDKPKENNQKINQKIIGSYKKKPIEYLVGKFGPALKIEIGSKCLFVNASNLNLSDPNIESNAVKFIEYKLKKLAEIKSKTTQSKTTQSTEVKSTEVKLTEVKSTEAKLTEAKLAKAKLTKAKLTKAKLTKAKLTKAKLTKAKSKTTKSTKLNIVKDKYHQNNKYDNDAFIDD
jgi:DNA topoisomerase-1